MPRSFFPSRERMLAITLAIATIGCGHRPDAGPASPRSSDDAMSSATAVSAGAEPPSDDDAAPEVGLDLHVAGGCGESSASTFLRPDGTVCTELRYAGAIEALGHALTCPPTDVTGDRCVTALCEDGSGAWAPFPLDARDGARERLALAMEDGGFVTMTAGAGALLSIRRRGRDGAIRAEVRFDPRRLTYADLSFALAPGGDVYVVGAVRGELRWPGVSPIRSAPLGLVIARLDPTTLAARWLASARGGETTHDALAVESDGSVIVTVAYRGRASIGRATLTARGSAGSGEPPFGRAAIHVDAEGQVGGALALSFDEGVEVGATLGRGGRAATAAPCGRRWMSGGEALIAVDFCAGAVELVARHRDDGPRTIAGSGGFLARADASVETVEIAREVPPVERIALASRAYLPVLERIDASPARMVLSGSLRPRDESAPAPRSRAFFLSVAGAARTRESLSLDRVPVPASCVARPPTVE
jgi:hypothetical protein